MDKPILFIKNTGFTILEVGIAASLVALAALVSSQILNLSNGGQVRLVIHKDIIESKEMISKILKDPAYCNENFSGFATDATGIAKLKKATRVFAKTSNAAERVQLKKEGHSSYIDNMKLVNFTKNDEKDIVNGTDEGGNEGSLFLQVDYKPLFKKYENITYSKFIPLYVVLDSLDKIVDCFLNDEEKGAETIEFDVCVQQNPPTSYASFIGVSSYENHRCTGFIENLIRPFFIPTAHSLCDQLGGVFTGAGPAAYCDFLPKEFQCPDHQLLRGYDDTGYPFCEAP